MNTVKDVLERGQTFRPASDHPERWTIDPSASTLTFKLRHIVISAIRGRFHRWGGNLFLDRAQPTRSSVEAWVELDSVDTGDPIRDAHVRSPEFLDVTRYPRATFKSTSLELSDERILVHGLLHLHGVARDLDLEVVPGRRWTDERGLQRESYAVHGSLDRQSFGLHWNQDLDIGGVVVGDVVDLLSHVEVTQVPDETGTAATPNPEGQ